MANFTATATAAEECHYTLDVTIPSEQVKTAFKKVRSQIRNSARIPGFRPGKAPDKLINKRYGDKIVDEVRQALLRDNLQSAIEQQELSPVTYPTIVPDKQGEVAEDKDFAFTVEFDVKPEISLPDYKGLELTQYKIEVSENQVQNTIDDLLEQRSTYEKVDREAEAGDLVKVGYHSSFSDGDEEVPDPAKRMVEVEETWLLLGEPEMIPGVAEGLVGVSADDERTLDVEFPDDFYEPFLAGKTGQYTFKIAEVHSRVRPELTDDFAKQLGAESVDDLKAKVRERLESQLEQGQSNHLHSQVIEKLLDGAEFPLPPKVFESEVEMVLREMDREKQQQQQQGGGDGEDDDEDARKAEAASRAGQRLRLRYLVEAIAEAEEVEVPFEEVQAQMDAIRSYQGLSEQQFRERYNEMAMAEGMYMNSMQDKVLDKLIEMAKITETEPPEPEADDKAEDE